MKWKFHQPNFASSTRFIEFEEQNRLPGYQQKQTNVFFVSKKSLPHHFCKSLSLGKIQGSMSPCPSTQSPRKSPALLSKRLRPEIPVAPSWKQQDWNLAMWWMQDMHLRVELIYEQMKIMNPYALVIAWNDLDHIFCVVNHNCGAHKNGWIWI